MPPPPADPAAIAARILAAPGYRALHPDLVQGVVAREAAKGRSAAATEKAARTRLHQAVGAYVPGKVTAERWLAHLAQAEDLPAQKEVCRRLLANHASARERLPLIDGFYAALFTGGAPLAVLDIACGLNPLALPWMGLPPGSRLIACDAQTDLTGFLAHALPLLEPTTGVACQVFAWNLLSGAPPVRADVALLLKTLPCLEPLDSTLPERLLQSVDAPLLYVSFPVRSLGGHARGMPATYAARYEGLFARLGWQAETVRTTGELVYRVHKT